LRVEVAPAITVAVVITAAVAVLIAATVAEETQTETKPRMILRDATSVTTRIATLSVDGRAGGRYDSRKKTDLGDGSRERHRERDRRSSYGCAHRTGIEIPGIATIMRMRILINCAVVGAVV